MASELVPGDFPSLKLMRVFADFRKNHKRLFGTSGELLISFIKKKKKKN